MNNIIQICVAALVAYLIYFCLTLVVTGVFLKIGLILIILAFAAFALRLFGIS